MADADLDLATDGIVWSAFGTTGQRCTAASRVIVDRTSSAPLLERLESRTRQLRLGDGSDPNDRRRAAHQRRRPRQGRGLHGVGRREGELITGGGAPSGADLDDGHFFEPTIFAGVKPMDRIAQEEIFGPVLSVIPVAGYQEAVTL